MSEPKSREIYVAELQSEVAALRQQVEQLTKEREALTEERDILAKKVIRRATCCYDNEQRAEAAESRAVAAEAALQQSEAGAAWRAADMKAALTKLRDACPCGTPRLCPWCLFSAVWIDQASSVSSPGASVLKRLEAAEGMARVLQRIDGGMYPDAPVALAKWAEVKP